jgi:hypothetical protein
MIRPLTLIILLVAGLGANRPQQTTHQFDPSKLRASSDSFVVVRLDSTGKWRTVGGVVQTIAHDSAAIRLAVEVLFPGSRQRVEMAMDPKTLAPIAHWETLTNRERGETKGEVMFRDGRARGAFILSKGVIDMPVDTGLVDDDASTALLATLPLDSARAFSFRTFASPGKVETTRVRVDGTEIVRTLAGDFHTHRLVVMARDTSTVFVTTTPPHRVVLVRLAGGTQEMRLINPQRQRREAAARTEGPGRGNNRR